MAIANLVTTIGATAYANTLSKKKIDEMVDSWLSYSDSGFDANTILHWSVELSSSLAQYGRTTGGRSIDSLVFTSLATLESAEAMSVINKMMAAVIIPNIEGIPIFSHRISTGRDVELSEQSLIMTGDKDSGKTRMRFVDNAVPRLRLWNVQGHILSIAPVLDYAAIVKPSLMMEIDYLDAVAKSGKPVWFKTHTNEFVRVQIQQFQFEWTAEKSTGVAISMTLKEYAPLFMSTTPVNKLVGKEIPDGDTVSN